MPTANDNLDVSIEVDDENEGDEYCLNDKQKYSMVTPILLRIGNLISCHPTKKFLRYLDGLNELEKRVRKGQNFMLQIGKIITEAEYESDDEEYESREDNIEEVRNNGDYAFLNAVENTSDEENNNDQSMNLRGVDNLTDNSQDTLREDEDDEADTVVPGPSKGKFSTVEFKQGLRTKGRPKKRSKQFTFKKTAVDRKANTQTKKRKKQHQQPEQKRRKMQTLKQKKPRKKQSIDETSSSESNADVELQLDDDSNDDIEEDEITFKL